MLRHATIIIWTLLLTLLVGPHPARAQENRASEYRVKAAFLLSFGKFVEWPASAFAGTNAPLVIGVVGRDPFHGDLERIVEGRQISGHPLVIRQIAASSELKECHLLFISASEKPRLKDHLRAVQGASVLTVSETDQFLKAGGIINFVVENEKIRFEINDAAANQVRLKISSKLLALARKSLAKAAPR